MKPTHDSVFLAQKINEHWNSRSLSPGALQRWVNLYGAGPVEDGLRLLSGFPPAEAIRSPYAYMETMLSENLIVPRSPQGELW